MSEFKVEKDIEMKPASKSKYPFAEMEVGDSFEFKSDLRSGVTSSARYFSYTHTGFSIKNKKSRDGYHRCWRTK